MQQKMLTIIVPAYNVEKYVGQCLDSLVHQTCKRFEVIIVDDGSKDKNTSTICKSYAQKYPEVFQYIRQDNKGLGAARNTGLRKVVTPYVSFLDSDDWLDTRFVEYVLDALEKNDDNSIDIVFTLPTVYDSLTQQMWDWMDKGTFNWIFPEHGHVVDMNIDERPYWLEPNACRRVYRTRFLTNINFSFPEGTRWEDVYPHFYLLSHAKRCMGVPDVGFYYRTNVPTSITATSGRGRLEVPTVFETALSYLLERQNTTLGIMNSCLKMCVTFSSWSIDVSQSKVRRELVDKLHTLYASVPSKRIKAFLKTPNLLTTKQKLFVKVLRSKHLHFLLYDYMPVAVGKVIIGKIARKLAMNRGK